MIGSTRYLAALLALAAMPGFSAGPWSGFYMGWSAGTGQAKAAFDMSPGGAWLTGSEASGVPWIASQGSTVLSPSTVATGLQLGYGWQKNQWVYGLEGDIAYTDLADTRRTAYRSTSEIDQPMQFREGVTSDGFVSLRSRLGVAKGNCLVYGTAGLAVANARFSSGYTYGSTLVSEGSRRQNLTGWAAGAGVEIASAGSPVTFKVEYLHMDFGKADAITTREINTVPGPPEPPSTYTTRHRFHLKESFVRVGFNYRFGIR